MVPDESIEGMRSLHVKFGMIVNIFYFVVCTLFTISNHSKFMERKMYGMIIFNLIFTVLFLGLVFSFYKAKNKHNPWQYECIIISMFIRLTVLMLDFNELKDWGD